MSQPYNVGDPTAPVAPTGLISTAQPIAGEPPILRRLLRPGRREEFDILQCAEANATLRVGLQRGVLVIFEVAMLERELNRTRRLGLAGPAERAERAVAASVIPGDHLARVHPGRRPPRDLPAARSPTCSGRTRASGRTAMTPCA